LGVREFETQSNDDRRHGQRNVDEGVKDPRESRRMSDDPERYAETKDHIEWNRDHRHANGQPQRGIHLGVRQGVDERGHAV
jgi:hypothetical protein